MLHSRAATDDSERIVEAARRVPRSNLVDRFRRYDAGSHGTIRRADFAQVLRALGVAATERDLLCRRFGARRLDWSCDYLDFCRLVELADDAMLRNLATHMSVVDASYHALRRPFLDADGRGSGYVPLRVFRRAILDDWEASVTELELQLLASRFAHPHDPNLVSYRVLTELVDDVNGGSTRRPNHWSPPRRDSSPRYDRCDSPPRLLQKDDRHLAWLENRSPRPSSPGRHRRRDDTPTFRFPTTGTGTTRRSVNEICRTVNGSRWACVVCFNTENPVTRTTCAVCQAPNPKLADTEVLLECKNCHFVNPDSAELCDMCNTDLRSKRKPRDKHDTGPDGWRTIVDVDDDHRRHAPRIPEL